MRRRSLRLISWIFFLFAIAVISIFMLADSQPYRAIFKPSQVWAHRGYTENHAQNSIPAFREAIRLGASGVEMDVYWDDSLHTFVISHDKPYRLPYGQILTLPMVMDSLPVQELFLWLDLKNLNKENAAVIIDSLQSLLAKHGAQKQVFVESENGWQLRKLDKVGIRTLYWVQYARSFPKKYIKLTYIKAMLLCSDFDGISTAYYLYDTSFQLNFSNYPIFVWYINDAEKIRDLIYNQPVNVVLTNTNLFYLNQRDQ